MNRAPNCRTSAKAEKWKEMVYKVGKREKSKKI